MGGGRGRGERREKKGGEVAEGKGGERGGRERGKVGEGVRAACFQIARTFYRIY